MDAGVRFLQILEKLFYIKAFMQGRRAAFAGDFDEAKRGHAVNLYGAGVVQNCIFKSREHFTLLGFAFHS